MLLIIKCCVSCCITYVLENYTRSIQYRSIYWFDVILSHMMKRNIITLKNEIIDPFDEMIIVHIYTYVGNLVAKPQINEYLYRQDTVEIVFKFDVQLRV